jgi:phage recombination protein Bet
VHLVPLWDSKAGQMRDVVMPGVNLYRTQASRSGQFAGMSEPEFGPMITETLGGQKISYPEWCRVVVKRALPSGIVAEFTAVEYWMENYAMKGGKERSVAPNAMWTKRPRGQIAKCASAQALRIAFPEIASAPTADEMEGKQIHQDEAHGELPLRDECIARVDAAQTADELRAISKECVAALNKARDMEGYGLLVQAVKARGAALKAQSEAQTVEAAPQEPQPETEGGVDGA